MKIYFLADTHLGMKGDDEDVLNDCYNYYNDVLIPYMRKNVKKDDILVHLGDVFDNRSNIGIHTIYYVIKLFEQFSEIFSDIRVCVGNHDMWQKNSTDITALHAIKYIPHVKLYFEPTVDNIDGKKILFMPWIENLKSQKEQCSFYKVDYVFGHLQIGGCVSNSKGTKLNSDDMTKSSDFNKAQVYAGHIHIRQDYKNVHYVGNPYHKDRGDIDNIKGITVLDLETGKTDFIENTYSPIYVYENIYDILNDTLGDVKKRWTNNYIDIGIKNSDLVNYSVDSLRDMLDNCFKEFRFKPDNSEVIVNINEDEIVGESKTSDDMLYDYINACDIEDDMKESVKNYLKKIREKL